jgi:ECF transporter S component (folate family)
MNLRRKESPTLSKIAQQEIANPLNERRNEPKKKYLSTRRITHIATLIAITLMFKMLGQFSIIGGTLKVSFTYFGWIISAVALGPFGGAVVGFTTDVLAMVLAPNGLTLNPLITLSSTLFPFIVGLAYKYLPLKNKNIRIIIGTAASTIVCTMFITTLGLYLIYVQKTAIPFFVYMITFRSLQPLFVAVNLTAALLVLPIATRLRLFESV